jgi:hypothetical protein
LMVAMSVFDICSSIAWGLTTLPIPQYQYGEPTGMYGTRGNKATCKMQGFFIQLGYTSIFYNMSLSFYFLLVVRFGLKESQLKKLQLWLHVPPLIVGFALAFGGIPFYTNSLSVCYIAPPPLVQGYRDIVIFAVVPICTAIAILTVNIVLVYWAVRKQMIEARKWQQRTSQTSGHYSSAGDPAASRDFPVNPDASGLSVQRRGPETVIQRMERETFWQALFYLSAFYVTWPIFVVSVLVEDSGGVYPFMLTVFTLAPMQGFWNFLIYARPRMLKQIQERRKSRKKLRLQRSSKDNSLTDNSTSGYFVSGKPHGLSADVNLGNTASTPELIKDKPADKADTEEDHQHLSDVPDLGRSSLLPVANVAAMVDSDSS